MSSTALTPLAGLLMSTVRGRGLDTSRCWPCSGPSAPSSASSWVPSSSGVPWDFSLPSYPLAGWPLQYNYMYRPVALIYVTLPVAFPYTVRRPPSWSTEIHWLHMRYRSRCALHRSITFHSIQHILEALLVHDCVCQDRHRSCYLHTPKIEPPCWRTRPYSRMIMSAAMGL